MHSLLLQAPRPPQPRSLQPLPLHLPLPLRPQEWMRAPQLPPPSSPQLLLPAPSSHPPTAPPQPPCLLLLLLLLLHLPLLLPSLYRHLHLGADQDLPSLPPRPLFPPSRPLSLTPTLPQNLLRQALRSLASHYCPIRPSVLAMKCDKLQAAATAPPPMPPPSWKEADPRSITRPLAPDLPLLAPPSRALSLSKHGRASPTCHWAARQQFPLHGRC